MLPLFSSDTLPVLICCHCFWCLLLYLSGNVVIVVGVCSITCLDMLSLLLAFALLSVWKCCHYCWRLPLYLSRYVVIVVGVCFSTCLDMLPLLAPDPLPVLICCLVIGFAPLPVLICCHCCWLLLLYLSWYVVAVLWSLLFFLHLKTMMLIFTPLTVKMLPLHLSGYVAAVVDVYHLEDGPSVQFWDVGASSRGLELHPASCLHLLHHLLITVVKECCFLQNFWKYKNSPVQIV